MEKKKKGKIKDIKCSAKNNDDKKENWNTMS